MISDYQKLKAAGLCRTCRQPSDYKTRCHKCTTKYNAQLKNMRDIRKQNGVCCICGNNITSQYWCDSCAIKRVGVLVKVKKKVIEAYGGKCSQCPENRLPCLELDHINNDGKADRERLGLTATRGGYRFYRELIKEGFPSNVQLLCANCHALKHSRWEEYMVRCA